MAMIAQILSIKIIPSSYFSYLRHLLNPYLTLRWPCPGIMQIYIAQPVGLCSAVAGSSTVRNGRKHAAVSHGSQNPTGKRLTKALRAKITGDARRARSHVPRSREPATTVARGSQVHVTNGVDAPVGKQTIVVIGNGMVGLKFLEKMREYDTSSMYEVRSRAAD